MAEEQQNLVNQINDAIAQDDPLGDRGQGQPQRQAQRQVQQPLLIHDELGGEMHTLMPLVPLLKRSSISPQPKASNSITKPLPLSIRIRQPRRTICHRNVLLSLLRKCVTDAMIMGQIQRWKFQMTFMIRMLVLLTYVNGPILTMTKSSFTSNLTSTFVIVNAKTILWFTRCL
jgi:hypothetical protein